MDVLWRGVGGSERKHPNDVVGEKIGMFVAPKAHFQYIRKSHAIGDMRFANTCDLRGE